MLPDFRPLASSRALLSLMAVIAADQIAGSVLNPFLPLIIQKLTPGGALVGSTTGVILGLGAVSSALAAFTIGRFSYRVGYQRTLIVCMVGAAIFMIPQAFARTPLQLLLLRIASCFFVGGQPPVGERAHRAADGTRASREASTASPARSPRAATPWDLSSALRSP